MTDLERVLTVVSIAEAIGILYLWIRSNAASNAVLLEIGKDKLRVIYWWIDEPDITGNPDLNLQKLYKTEDEENIQYVYDIEGAETLVSKERSNAVSTKIGAIMPPSKKPPPINKVNAVLMAIEITVVER